MQKIKLAADTLREAVNRNLRQGAGAMHGHLLNKDVIIEKPHFGPIANLKSGEIWSHFEAKDGHQHPVPFQEDKLCVGHCALGILHLAAHNWNEEEAFDCYGRAKSGRDTAGQFYDEIEGHFDGRFDCQCPECGKILNLITSTLVHLNDFHRWSYQKIAGFLDVSTKT